ncbi:hypothetical protein BLNAU_7913 [Blattamonas nauphoetae]|uniref:MYND-type domain-containing protein n=1 Tax=Blattamonas nauphoetae TaxID=2049346 RepID=A0ABQ9Y040_9EUKA|nr:hypothetical protein BLNAU_7913 [Blattamonas nauphoetae]
MSNTCVLCGKPAKFQCSSCHNVRYCSREHQKTHWPQHKPVCIGPKPAQQRPTMSISFEPLERQITLSTWEHYFSTRNIFSTPLSPSSYQDPHVLHLSEGLSFSLTILFALQQMHITPSVGLERPNFIYIVGANNAMEQAQVTDKNLGKHCWAEIGKFYPKSQFGIILIGPDISSELESKVEIVAGNVFCTFVRAHFDEYIENERMLRGDRPDEKPLIIAMFNPGFGIVGEESNIQDQSLQSDDAIKPDTTRPTEDIEVIQRTGWRRSMNVLMALETPVIATILNETDDLEHTKQFLSEYIQSEDSLPFIPNPFASLRVLRKGETSSDDIIRNKLLFGFQSNRYLSFT